MSVLCPVEAFEKTVQMFGRYAFACVGKAEVVEVLVFAETIDVDVDIVSGISDGIVHQVAEDGVEQ